MLLGIVGTAESDMSALVEKGVRAGVQVQKQRMGRKGQTWPYPWEL